MQELLLAASRQWRVSLARLPSSPWRFCFRNHNICRFFIWVNVSVSSAWGGLQVVCYTGVGLHRKWHMQPDWDGPQRWKHKHRAQMGPRASGSSTLMNTQLSTTLHNMQNNILRPAVKNRTKIIWISLHNELFIPFLKGPRQKVSSLLYWWFHSISQYITDCMTKHFSHKCKQFI